MTPRFLLFLGIGLVVIVAAIFGVFTGTKGSHLELKGQILKVRTGKIDEAHSAVMLDFRVTNPSNLHFVAADVEVSVLEPNGESVAGNIIARNDIGQLLAYNRFFGTQYNPVISIRDKINPHSTADRMVAAQFDLPVEELEKARKIHLRIQDLDGPTFEADANPK